MKRHILPLIAFTLLTLLILHPVLLNIENSIPENLGDPLFNTWVLAWDVKEILHDPRGLFDANIFYPYDNTLSYSDHLIVPALISLPAIWPTDNPVLGYNLLFLLSFLLSGFGMYLLVHHLTRNPFAAFLSGMIYAFSPFRFHHLGHIQVLNTEWIPFALLYLHRYIEHNSLKNALLFVLFFLLQALSSSYFALFLPVVIAMILVYKMLSGELRPRFPQLIHGITALTLIILAALPFFIRYRELGGEFNFSRSVSELEYFSADLSSYLAVPVSNFLYGGVLEAFARPEGISFLGFTVIFMIVYGLIKGRSPSERDHPLVERSLKHLDNLLSLLILISLVAVAVILVREHGTAFQFLGQKVSLSRVNNPIFYILSFLFAKVFIHLYRYDRPQKNELILYYVIFAASFLLSLGPTMRVGGKAVMPGPYALLYHFAPGFEGLRAPGRFALFTVAASAVLFGLHYGQLSSRISSRMRCITASILAALIMLEFYTGPVEMWKVPTKKDVPPIYRWVEERADESAIVELPIGNIWREAGYVYSSTFHWKRLLNGYSGFFPPMYEYAREVLSWFPSGDSIRLLRDLGVRYVLVHSEFYRSNFEKFQERLSRFDHELRLVDNIDGVMIFQLLDQGDGEGGKPGSDPTDTLSALENDDWRVSASRNREDAHLAIDGRIETRWSTMGPQVPGDYIQIDLEGEHNVSGIALWLNDDPYDFPRGCLIQASMDGERWDTIEGDYSCTPPPNFYLHNPRNPSARIHFDPVRARFIKIVQIYASENYYWSIHELKLYGNE